MGMVPFERHGMTSKEFKRAFEIASTKWGLSDHDIGVFDGFGLSDFEPVVVTLKQVARLIKYQAQYMDGTWDNDALDEIKNHGRHKFMVVDADLCPICNGSGCQRCDNAGSWAGYKAHKNRMTRNTSSRAINAFLRETCGTTAKAAKEDMGL